MRIDIFGDLPGRARGGNGAGAHGKFLQGVRAGTEPCLDPPDDGKRISDEQPWDEANRPAAPLPDPERLYTPAEQASAQLLLDVHGQLRAELVRLRDLMTQVGHGSTNPAAVRSFFNRMMIRQNNWTLGAFCESYCRAVSTHHTLEDRRLFPHLQAADATLSGVLDRLAQEHEVIASIVERIDAALVALVAAEPDRMTRVREAVDLLTMRSPHTCRMRSESSLNRWRV